MSAKISDVSLPALSLDAAVELDRLDRKLPADLTVVSELIRRLMSSDDRQGYHAALGLQDPIGVEVLRSALDRSGDSPTKVSDLSDRLSKLIAEMAEIADGKQDGTVKVLKRFCLSLHQAFLSEASPPFRSQDEWILAKEQPFA